MYQEIILGCILLATLHYFSKRTHDSKLNVPPLVDYKIPIIGHTYNYFFNCEEFLKQCREEHGDIFNLYIWGEVKTFVGKEHSQEVLTNDNAFSFQKAFNKRFPGEALLKNLAENSITKSIKGNVLNKLKSYTERMQKSLYYATQKRIGVEDQNVCRNSYHLMTKIISTPIANICMGEEESEYEEVIDTFAKFTSDTAKFLAIPPFLDFIYLGLQNYVNRLPLRLGLYNPAAKHQKILIKHIKNQVYKRSQDKQKYGDSWKRPNDYLQDLIEIEDPELNNIDNINYPTLTDLMCGFIFASIHTTSNGCANAMMDLASRPEYIQELYEEQLEIHKDADKDGILPFESLNKMKKLDSFIRESLRLSGTLAGLPHLTLKDYTFSNGLQVPKDRDVVLYFDDIYRDESLQGSNPKSFEPFRHLNTNALASKVSKDYVVFGGGKHACPGRYFAINEIKFFMHNILLKYNFRTESGEFEEKRKFGPISFPSSGGIIFEKRK